MLPHCTLLFHLLVHAFVKKVLSFEPQDGEYDGAAVDGCDSVAEGEHQDVFDTILVRWVVAAETDHRSESKTVRVKHLCDMKFLSNYLVQVSVVCSVPGSQHPSTRWG